MTQRAPQETADALLAVCTEWMPPGEYGKFQLIFPDTAQADPLNNRWLQALGGANNEIEVYDLNAQNCILEKELCYVVYDADWGCFVPVGSSGLIRRAVAIEDHLYYGPGSTFEVEIRGAESLTHVLTVSAEWTSEPVYQSEKMWVVYVPFDQPALGGRPQRTGAWYRIQRIPGDTKLFQAPSGGIPAAVNTFMGAANCSVLERQPGTDSVQGAATGETIRVYNWTPNVIAKDGSRIGIAAYMLGGWFAIADYCQEGGQAAGANNVSGSTQSFVSTSSVSIEDYSGGNGFSLLPADSFVYTAGLDPDLVEFSNPVASLSGTIAGITLSSASSGYVPL
jgi:hypothetical protein